MLIKNPSLRGDSKERQKETLVIKEEQNETTSKPKKMTKLSQKQSFDDKIGIFEIDHSVIQQVNEEEEDFDTASNTDLNIVSLPKIGTSLKPLKTENAIIPRKGRGHNRFASVPATLKNRLDSSVDQQVKNSMVTPNQILTLLNDKSLQTSSRMDNS